MGTTYIRYSVAGSFVASDLDTNASGSVTAFVKQQGNSDHQKLTIKVKALDPLTPYVLLAQVGDDTNLVTVTNFVTGARGARTISYSQNRALRDNGHKGKGSGVNKRTLPAALSPLTDVRVFVVANTNGEVVLTADLHASPTLDFQMASTFMNTGTDPNAIGCVAMAVQNGFTEFRLFAGGQSSEYKLEVNSTPVATYHADFTGRIAVGMLPPGAPSPMRVRSMTLRNAAEEAILASSVE